MWHVGIQHKLKEPIRMGSSVYALFTAKPNGRWKLRTPWFSDMSVFRHVIMLPFIKAGREPEQTVKGTRFIGPSSAHTALSEVNAKSSMFLNAIAFRTNHTYYRAKKKKNIRHACVVCRAQRHETNNRSK